MKKHDPFPYELKGAKHIFICSLLGCLALSIFILLRPGQVCALTVQEEVEIDRLAGLLDRPWRINLIRISTRDYLKRRAVVRTGFRRIDRDAHKADAAPQGQPESISRAPKSATSAPRQAPSEQPAPTPVIAQPSQPSPSKIDPGLDPTPPVNEPTQPSPSPSKIDPGLDPTPSLPPFQMWGTGL